MCKVVVAVILMLVSAAFAGEPQTVEQLRARAESAKPADQVKLYLEIADQQLKFADGYFGQGDIVRGKATVDDLVMACEKAGAAARASRKHEKQTEIRVRDVERRLEAIRQNISFEDRPALKDAIARLDKVRSDLLLAMFGSKL